MEVKNCKNCGRLYNYIGGVYRLCPECMRKLEEKFQEVKDYIEDNPRADMREISSGSYGSSAYFACNTNR